jgi:hypothetical protein
MIFVEVRLSPLGTPAGVGPIIPVPDDNEECGAVGGLRAGRENQPQCHFLHYKSYMT